VSRPASLAWFTAHELRLFWRDWLTMLTAGKRNREPVLAVVALVLVAALHGVAWFIVALLIGTDIGPDRMTLITLTGAAFMSWTMMLSQAIEAVTRAFYTRADLDLILASPASARRVFAIRMVAIAFSSTVLITALAGPFINVLAVREGAHWLAGYGVLLAMGALSTALAVVVTMALLRVVGAKRTRLISQIVSALVAATFVVGVQAVALISTGSVSRFALLRSEGFLALMPDAASVLWWPARAAMGDGIALAAVLALGLGLLGLIVALFSANFGAHVVAASGVAFGATNRRRRTRGFRIGSVGRVLLRKELILLRRDPWLVSQTLMQVLYLLLPALLLWRNFGDGVSALLFTVPVLVMASGQLTGGLAWLAVAGEDAPDLVATAPVRARALMVAKIEAVLGSIAVVVSPLVLVLGIAVPRFGVVAAFGIAAAAVSGALIQFWFRAAAARNTLRGRRPSRIATLLEALSSTLWAGTAALAAFASWYAVGPATVALLALALAWSIRPR
jgi:ABC-2 type transport system permease protein